MGANVHGCFRTLGDVGMGCPMQAISPYPKGTVPWRSHLPLVPHLAAVGLSLIVRMHFATSSPSVHAPTTAPEPRRMLPAFQTPLVTI